MSKTMNETLKLAQMLVASVTNEARTVRAPMLKERLDMLNVAYRLATSLADLLKTVQDLSMPK